MSAPARYRYHVLPFQPSVKEGATSAAVAAQLQSLIDQCASQGWEYYRIEQINVSIAPGCLGALFGAKPVPWVIQSAVFRLPLE